jgi:hypothetical protein
MTLVHMYMILVPFKPHLNTTRSMHVCIYVSMECMRAYTNMHVPD